MSKHLLPIDYYIISDRFRHSKDAETPAQYEVIQTTEKVIFNQCMEL